MKIVHLIFLSTLLRSLPAYGQGTTLWNEGVDGSLSQDFGHPTVPSAMRAGTNSVVGVTEVEPVGPIWYGHPDFFVITIPNGLSLTAVYLAIDKPNVWTWIGDSAYSNELGISMNPINGELLAQWGSTTVTANSYGVYLSNHDQQPVTSLANYRLDFVIVPEPSSLCFLTAGVFWLALRFWQTRTRSTKQP